ncbi:glycosyl transferase family 1, partial [bacterium]|nr:glycosyl transferase family 1 [bacterium]
MNILICNERFLFRFGADRVLTLLGKSLDELGYNVYIMANKYDKRVVKTFATRVIEVPTDTDDYLNLNEHTAEWLERTWDEYFDNDNIPDIILVGGWPFFSSIPFFKKVSREVIFIDFGAVPLDGYSGGALVIQEKLRSLRKQYLKEASLIIGISDFIVNSQSRVDSNGKVPVRTVLLGADHMEMRIWAAKHLHIEKSYGNTINLLKHLKQEGRKIILCLGRWEPNCYKNSDAAFDIMHQITRVFPDCALLILADPSGVNIPPDLQKSIFPIRFPDDKEL